MKRNPVAYIDTMLRYYLGIDPDTLDDDQWAETFMQLADIRKRELQSGSR